MCNCTGVGFNPFFNPWISSQPYCGQPQSTPSIFSGPPYNPSPQYPQQNTGQFGGFNMMQFFMMMMMMMMGKKAGEESKNSDIETNNADTSSECNDCKTEKSEGVDETENTDDNASEMTIGEALNLIKGNYDLVKEAHKEGGGIAHLEDLKAIANGTGYSEEIKEAARLLINNPEIFNAMESSNDKDNNKDSKFSTKDIDRYLEENPKTANLTHSDLNEDG